MIRSNSFGDSCDKEFIVGGLIIGRVTIRDKETFCELWNLSIDKEFRGIGLGNQLLFDIIEYCEGKFSKIWLGVFQENTVAVNLYESWGFKFIDSDWNRPYSQMELTLKESRKP